MHRPLTAAVALTLTACSAWRIQHPQDTLQVNAPATWREAGQGQHAEISTGWLDEFKDPGMHSIVREAIESNRDLQAAAARLKAAREDPIIARAARLPAVNLSGQGSRTWLENGDDPSTRFSSYGLALSAGWEIDLWGRLRDIERASFADYDAALATFRGARLSLAVNAGKAWCNLIAAKQQVALAEYTLDSFQKNLRVIERNYKAGVPGVSSLDVNFGSTNVAAAERALRQTRLDRDDAARTLEVLAGRYPAGSIRSPDELPGLRRTVAAGIPADMLERRPDLAVARARILASAKRSDAARKALLPSIGLTGSTGTAAASFGRLFDADYLVSSIAASLQQIVFDGGATAAEARAILARNEAAVAEYAQLTLEAMREVEAALAADRSLAEQQVFLEREVEQAALAESQAERDYSEGLEGSSILAVLEAQRRATNSRAALIRLRNSRLQTRLDLHLALGGDFETAP